MKKLTSLFCLLFLFFQFKGQEILSPLIFNQSILSTQNASRSINDLYIYEKDTIHLPFKDDFSRDLFKKYNATPTDTNVSDTMFYAIYIGSNPDLDTASYMEDTSYLYEITVYPGDSLGYDTIPQASINITWCDLNQFPVICQTKTVWPANTIYDSLHTPQSPDGIYAITNPDIIQDSATVYFVSVVDTTSRWIDNHTFLNNTYQINPPTIGVATFDGLNENGYPYDFTSVFSYGIADYLTSKPIFLDKDELGNPYGISDSVYLSFYYQPQGLGNEPELEDSLVLQFWSPGDSTWFSMWSTAGRALDSSFTRIMVPILQNRFFDKGFQFRFLNYSSLSGSFDHWNIDYVYLESNRFIGDTVPKDVAFVEPVNTLLKKYTAMPWKHYKWDVHGFMQDSILTDQINQDNVAHLIGGLNLDVSYQQNLLQTINNPNTPSVNAFNSFQTEFPIGYNSFFYDTTVNDTCAIFDLSIRHVSTPDLLRFNDTIFFKQEFADYYAYDDASAEAAYGVQGIGGILPQIASKFNLVQGDTLKSLHIHFSPSAYDRSSTPLILTVWQEGAGGKPGNVKYENITYATPIYNIGVNGFHEYKFDAKVYLPAGNYFVGWKQTTADVINVGYDLNINNNGNTYYNSDGVWRNSSKNGTLMIRPSFVFKKDYLIGLDETVKENMPPTLYPNPTKEYVYIKDIDAAKTYNYCIFSLNGKIIQKGTYKNGIDLSDYENGLYIITLLSENDIIHYHKIIKD